MDSVTARIWPREIKGKAEGGSVILGIQNEYMRGQKHRIQAKRLRRSEEDHKEAVQNLKIKQAENPRRAVSSKTSHGKGRGVGKCSQKIHFPSNFQRR